MDIALDIQKYPAVIFLLNFTRGKAPITRHYFIELSMQRLVKA